MDNRIEEWKQSLNELELDEEDIAQECYAKFSKSIRDVAKEVIGKIQVRHRFHKTRLRKSYEKLRKEINKLNKEWHLHLADTASREFRQIEVKKDKLRTLKLRVKSERIRYLSRQVNKAVDLNDKRKVFALLKDFKSEHIKTGQTTIKIIRDSNGKIARDTTRIHDVFLEYWQEMFTHNGDNLRDDIFTAVEAVQAPPYSPTQSERKR